MASIGKPFARVAVMDWNRVFCAGLIVVLSEVGFEADAPGDLMGWVSTDVDQVVIVSFDDYRERGRRIVETAVNPGIPVIAIAERGDELALCEAIDEGAVGALTRDASRALYVEAVRAVLAGYSFLPAQVVRLRLSLPLTRPRVYLAAEQVALLTLLGAGATVGDIASKIGWSPRTTHRRLRALYAQLGVSGHASAVAKAGELGLQTTVNPVPSMQR